MTTVMLNTATMPEALDRVRDMVRAGTPFEHIEAHIEEQPLDDEQKAICWLYGWFEGEAQVMAALLGRIGES